MSKSKQHCKKLRIWRTRSNWFVKIQNWRNIFIDSLHLFDAVKIYNRTNNFGIQNKNNIDFHFQTWKNRKTTGAIAPKILKQLPLPGANQITTEVLSRVKDPNNYQDREVQNNELVLIDIEITDDEQRAAYITNKML